MKKFNPEKELYKMQNKDDNLNVRSKMGNIFVPIFVLGCACLAMVGITFSANLINSTRGEYEVTIDVINGEIEQFNKTVSEGAFSTTINSANSFGSINCISGSLSFDPITNNVYSNYINKDTYCILSFQNDGTKNISVSELGSINDNFGLSYYFKGDADNNYLELNGEMYRIVRINGDGSYRVISTNTYLTSNYGVNNNYDSSNLKNVLYKWFNERFKDNKYVVQEDFDVSNYVEYTIGNLVNMEGYSVEYVGTLSVREVELINKDVPSGSYLGDNKFLLMNANGIDDVYVYTNNSIASTKPSIVLPVKPVINLMIDNLSGNGTLENPYKIGE